MFDWTFCVDGISRKKPESYLLQWGNGSMTASSILLLISVGFGWALQNHLHFSVEKTIFYLCIPHRSFSSL